MMVQGVVKPAPGLNFASKTRCTPLGHERRLRSLRDVRYSFNSDAKADIAGSPSWESEPGKANRNIDSQILQCVSAVALTGQR
jgi:hypothetical protein